MGTSKKISELGLDNNPSGSDRVATQKGEENRGVEFSKFPISEAASSAIDVVSESIDLHERDTGNPHGVTKSQIGLGSVPNIDATVRGNHSGTQPASTIDDLAVALATYLAAHLSAGANVTISTDPTTKIITIATTGGGSSFAVSDPHFWTAQQVFETGISGDAPVVFRRSGGTAGIDEIRIAHDGTRTVIESKGGPIRFLTSALAWGLEIDQTAGGVPTIVGAGGQVVAFKGRLGEGGVGWQVDTSTGSFGPGGNYGLVFHADFNQPYDSGFARYGVAATKSTDGTVAGWGDHRAITLFGRRNTEPADSELVAGEYCDWLDATPGAAKRKFKARDSSGTVVRGEVPLM